MTNERLRVSRRNTVEHFEFIQCFAFCVSPRNTPPLSHCFYDVFPCFECVSPKGERTARNTRAAVLLGEAVR